MKIIQAHNQAAARHEKFASFVMALDNKLADKASSAEEYNNLATLKKRLDDVVSDIRAAHPRPALKGVPCAAPTPAAAAAAPTPAAAAAVPTPAAAAAAPKPAAAVKFRMSWMRATKPSGPFDVPVWEKPCLGKDGCCGIRCWAQNVRFEQRHAQALVAIQAAARARTHSDTSAAYAERAKLIEKSRTNYAILEKLDESYDKLVLDARKLFTAKTATIKDQQKIGAAFKANFAALRDALEAADTCRKRKREELLAEAAAAEKIAAAKRLEAAQL